MKEDGNELSDSFIFFRFEKKNGHRS